MIHRTCTLPAPVTSRRSFHGHAIIFDRCYRYTTRLRALSFYVFRTLQATPFRALRCWRTSRGLSHTNRGGRSTRTASFVFCTRKFSIDTICRYLCRHVVRRHKYQHVYLRSKYTEGKHVVPHRRTSPDNHPPRPPNQRRGFNEFVRTPTKGSVCFLLVCSFLRSSWCSCFVWNMIELIYRMFLAFQSSIQIDCGKGVKQTSLIWSGSCCSNNVIPRAPPTPTHHENDHERRENTAGFIHRGANTI